MRQVIDIKELQKIQYNILVEFDRFCKEHNLKYFLAYGTLLGAVRHKGFIPWDNDVDVCMLRDEYEKLIKLYKDNRYRLMSVERCKRNEYTYAHAKMVDSETVLIEKFQPDKELGVYIDVFPLDYLCNGEKDYDLILKRYNRINYLETAVGIKGKVLKILGRKQLARIYKFIHKNNKNKSKYVGNCCATNASGDIYNLDWFDKTKKMHFEGDVFLVPVEYKRVLERRYGNYMELPPIEERKPQHDFDAYIK